MYIYRYIHFFPATEFLSVCFHVEWEYLPLENNRGFNFLLCVYCTNFNTSEKTLTLVLSFIPGILCANSAWFSSLFSPAVFHVFTFNPKLRSSFAEHPHLDLYISYLAGWPLVSTQILFLFFLAPFQIQSEVLLSYCLSPPLVFLCHKYFPSLLPLCFPFQDTFLLLNVLRVCHFS